MAELIAAITKEHMIFIFALIFIIVFRNAISGLINRTEKIGKDGLIASNSPEAQNEASESTAESVQKLLDGVGNSIVINDQESRILSELKSQNLDVTGDSVKVLVKYLAGTQLLLAFEQIHNSIFGSQIKLLKKLNELAGQGRSAAFIEKHFDNVLKQYPEIKEDWDVNRYLEFMFSHLLITQDGNLFHITNLGVEYLTWVARNGKYEDRYL